MSVDPSCLFCRNSDGEFLREEHSVPKSLGNNSRAGLIERELVLPPGEVCDDCNGGQLAVLDKALADWPPVSINRTLLQIRNRKGKLVDAAAGTRWRVTLDPDDPRLFELHVEGDVGPDSGRDNVARALCKIALETRCMDDREDARSARWDQLRAAVLGGPLPVGLSMYAHFALSVEELDPTPSVSLDVTPNDANLAFACEVFICGQPLLLTLGAKLGHDPKVAAWTVGAGGSLVGPNRMWSTMKGIGETARRLDPDAFPTGQTGPDAANLPTGSKRATVRLVSPRTPGLPQRQDS